MPLAEEKFFAPPSFSPADKVLDVGCGARKKVPWAVGLDRVKTPATDVVHDLDSFPWPFPDGSFDAVVASHVVEHLRDVPALCRELHRIGKPGALIRIATPHYSSPGAFTDPTHRRFFGYQTFEYFVRPEDAPQPALQRLAGRLFGLGRDNPDWYGKPLFEIVSRRLTFGRLQRCLGLEFLANLAPLVYEQNFAWMFPARSLLVLLRVKK